jgi:predicted kinase
LTATAPLAVLLVGITGSGKTTLAQALVGRGLVRLSVDEEVHRLHVRYSVDYPEHEYFERERPVINMVRQQLIDHLRGHDVVLDHGLWLRKDRDGWRKTVASVGSIWRLVYPPVQQDELLRRLAQRNQRQDANALTVTTSALKDFFARFQPPAPTRTPSSIPGTPNRYTRRSDNADHPAHAASTSIRSTRYAVRVGVSAPGSRRSAGTLLGNPQRHDPGGSGGVGGAELVVQ